MKKTDSPKPELPRVFAARFTKTQFMRLSLPERELLIRLGVAQNDLLFLNRLWGAHYYRNPQTQLAQEAQAVHQTTLLLLMVAKVFEALEVFRINFLSWPEHRSYVDKFKPHQLEALRLLRRATGNSGVLASVRNDFAFHYHRAPLSRFMRSWPADKPLSMYFGDPDGNTLNAYAAEPYLTALRRMTGRRTPNAALRFIQREALKVLQPFSTLVAAVQVIALKVMFGGDVDSPEEIEIRDDEYLPHDKFQLPFMMGRATNLTRSVRAALKRQRDGQTG